MVLHGDDDTLHRHLHALRGGLDDAQVGLMRHDPVHIGARKPGLPMERVVVTVQDHGNTSAASIPLALSVAVTDGRIKRGDLVLSEAIGGGLAWGAVVLRW